MIGNTSGSNIGGPKSRNPNANQSKVGKLRSGNSIGVTGNRDGLGGLSIGSNNGQKLNPNSKSPAMTKSFGPGNYNAGGFSASQHQQQL